MKTEPTKQSAVQRTWHLVNVKNKTLGRTAVTIAQLLRGKHKPYFVSHLDCGDYVVVINAADVAVTGAKEEKKLYTRYSGYPGGLKTETLGSLRARKPGQVVYHAVAGMLPKNKLRSRWLARLYVFAGADNPYGEQLNGKTVETPVVQKKK